MYIVILLHLLYINRIHGFGLTISLPIIHLNKFAYKNVILL